MKYLQHDEPLTDNVVGLSLSLQRFVEGGQPGLEVQDLAQVVCLVAQAVEAAGTYAKKMHKWKSIRIR